MSKRRKQNRSQSSHTKRAESAPDPRSLPQLLNGIQLFLVGTLMTARYFLPAESAPQGETLYLALGWFVVAILFSISLLLERFRVVRIDYFDLSVWLLISGQVISTIVMITFYQGQQRAALNMMWEWVALGFTFSIIRRLLVTTPLRNTFLKGFLTTIVLLSLYGIWQHHWMYEQLSKEYLAVRQQLDTAVSPSVRSEAQQKLISMGVPAHALSGSGRKLFEQRFLNSSEPLGMFALANTFAGLLVVGFLIALSQTIQMLFFKTNTDSSKGTRYKSWILVFPTLLIGYCLILTKSRSALLGVIGGLISLGLLKLIQNRQHSSEQKQRWKKLVLKSVIAGTVLILGFILLATFSGGFDKEVLTEAPKSIQYRLEYWTATWDVIKENPLWGTGPGNFREHYLKFKLPGSSEEISDPHNLFLDVWANAGITAFAGLALTLMLACYHWVSKPISDNLALDVKNETWNTETPYAQGALLLGFALSFLLLWGVQLFLFSIDESLLWIFCLGWLVIYPVLNIGWRTCNDSDQVNAPSTSIPLALAAAFIALNIHLLVAGGIAMPAITQSWLLLLALAFPIFPQSANAEEQMDSKSKTHKESPRKTIHLKPLLLITSLLLFVFFIISSFAPTIQRKRLVGEGERMLMNGQSVRAAQQYFIRAHEADPLSPAPWQTLAEIQWNQGTQNQDTFAQGVKLKKEAIQRDPLNPGHYFELGQRFYQQYQVSNRKEDLDDAIINLEQAIKGYPNNARYRAIFAETLFDAGKWQSSRNQAQQALELDQANRSAQHIDKYLKKELLTRLNEIINVSQSNEN